MNVLHRFIDFVLPPRCIVTGDFVDGQGMIAPAAWRDLNFIADPKCIRCGIPFEFMEEAVRDKSVCAACLKSSLHYNMVRSALVYDDFSRDLILGFKHGDQTQNVATFVPWLEQAGADILHDADYLIPVPLHPYRLLRRRFNQSGLMAKYISDKTNIPVLLEGLRRVRATPTQGYLKTKERYKNVNNAFIVPDESRALLRHKKIVLIDDVFTTGATASECTKALLNNQVGAVSVLTLARVVKPVRV